MSKEQFQQSAPNHDENAQDSEAAPNSAGTANHRNFVRDVLVVTGVATSLLVATTPTQAKELRPIDESITSSSASKSSISEATDQSAKGEMSPSFSQHLVSTTTQLSPKSRLSNDKGKLLDGVRIAGDTHTDKQYHYYSHLDRPAVNNPGVHTDSRGLHWDTHEDIFGKISAHQDGAWGHGDVVTRHEDTAHQDVAKGTHADNHQDNTTHG